MQVVTELNANASTRIVPAVTANLQALMEIRDNAVHYLNASPQLSKQVLEIGTACVKNFVEANRRWFDHDLSQYNLFLMPIAFVSAPRATAVSLATDEENLLNYLHGVVEKARDDPGSGFHVSLEVNLEFRRSREDAVASYAVTDDPNAPAVMVKEEDIRKTYRWSYAELTGYLRKRYVDFKQNAKYHGIRSALKENSKYCSARYLDPGNPRSAKKEFFNPNIVSQFDKHYTVK